MKITQVTKDYIMNNLSDLENDNIYRLILCDDSHGNTGKRHLALRVKPLKNLTVEELSSADTDNTSFIVVEED